MRDGDRAGNLHSKSSKRIKRVVVRTSIAEKIARFIRG